MFSKYLLFQEEICIHESNSYQQIQLALARGGGYSVQKTLWKHAANMGSKISLLVYEWPLIKCRIWYMNGSIFQTFPKFQPKLAQIFKKFGKIRQFCSKFGPKLGWVVYEWVTFSCKIGICMGLLSQWHIPTKTKLEYPQALVYVTQSEVNYHISESKSISSVSIPLSLQMTGSQWCTFSFEMLQKPPANIHQLV